MKMIFHEIKKTKQQQVHKENFKEEKIIIRKYVSQSAVVEQQLNTTPHPLSAICVFVGG